MIPVPSNNLETALKHLEDGGMLCVSTYARFTVITKKTLDKFNNSGTWLLKEDGNGYRLRHGKGSVYLFPGQLKYYGGKHAGVYEK